MDKTIEATPQVAGANDEPNSMAVDEEIIINRMPSVGGGLVTHHPMQAVSSDSFHTPASSFLLSSETLRNALGGDGDSASDQSNGQKERTISEESLGITLSRSYSHSIKEEFDPLSPGEETADKNAEMINLEATQNKTPQKVISTTTQHSGSLLDLGSPLQEPRSPSSRPVYSEREWQSMRKELEGRSEMKVELLQEEITRLQDKFHLAVGAAEEMRGLLAEYERTMRQLIDGRSSATGSSPAASVALQQQQMLMEMQSLQIALTNMRQRYEETKLANEQLRLHEQSLKSNLAALQADLQASNRKYDNLRQHAEERLTEANQELHHLKTTLSIELSSTKAKLHKAELRIASLEATVEAKSRENAEFMAICDELIQKIDSQAASVAGSSKTGSALLASLRPNPTL